MIKGWNERKKKENEEKYHPLSHTRFSPICGESIFRFKAASEQERCFSQCGLPFASKSHHKWQGWGVSLCVTWRIRAAAYCTSTARSYTQATLLISSSGVKDAPGELTPQSLCWEGSLDLWHVWKHQQFFGLGAQPQASRLPPSLPSRAVSCTHPGLLHSHTASSKLQIVPAALTTQAMAFSV